MWICVSADWQAPRSSQHAIPVQCFGLLDEVWICIIPGTQGLQQTILKILDAGRARVQLSLSPLLAWRTCLLRLLQSPAAAGPSLLRLCRRSTTSCVVTVKMAVGQAILRLICLLCVSSVIVSRWQIPMPLRALSRNRSTSKSIATDCSTRPWLQSPGVRLRIRSALVNLCSACWVFPKLRRASKVGSCSRTAAVCMRQGLLCCSPCLTGPSGGWP